MNDDDEAMAAAGFVNAAVAAMTIYAEDRFDKSRSRHRAPSCDPIEPGPSSPLRPSDSRSDAMSESDESVWGSEGKYSTLELMSAAPYTHALSRRSGRIAWAPRIS
jgi:hypothetical protein